MNKEKCDCLFDTKNKKFGFTAKNAKIKEYFEMSKLKKLVAYMPKQI